MAAVAFAACTAPALALQAKKPSTKPTTVRGRVVKVHGTDRFVVRTSDNREVILRTRTATKFLRNKQAVRFADLRAGIPVTVLVDEDGKDLFATSVTLDEVVAEEDATTLEGTIVRVRETENEIVVRTSAGKEVILVTNKAAKITLNNRTVRLTALQPGMAIKANFAVKNKKNMAHSIVVTPKRPK